MPNALVNAEETSLWECLHDGSIESLSSDLAARKLTIQVDSDFHWEFHGLPPNTRFNIILEGVQLVELLEFEAWPNAREVPINTPWDEAQKQRQADSEMGRRRSVDWNEFITQVQNGEGYIIHQAAIRNSSGPACLLDLATMSYPRSNYRELKIRSERIRFFIGQERELILEEFLRFGSAYWEAFAARGTSQDIGI